MAICDCTKTFDWIPGSKWQSVRASYEETEEKRREEMSESNETTSKFMLVIMDKGVSTIGPWVIEAKDREDALVKAGIALAVHSPDEEVRKGLEVAVRPF